MSTAVASGTSELLPELRRLCARPPLPQPSWHPYVAQIATCRGDFEQALEAYRLLLVGLSHTIAL